MSAARIPRELRPLARYACKAGWHISVTRGGHLRWRSPDGELVFTARTPSDRRNRLNVRAELRRAGLDA